MAIDVSLILLTAFAPSKPAPTTSSAIGVAVCAILVTAFNGIAGIFIPNIENGSPRNIPIMIGFLTR